MGSKERRSFQGTKHSLNPHFDVALVKYQIFSIQLTFSYIFYKDIQSSNTLFLNNRII